MTVSTKELAERGVDPSWRRWRRDRGLTLRSMAAMLDVDHNTLRRLETGVRVHPHTILVWQLFVARWENVPEFREGLAEEVHRTKMRYRAAALKRNAERGHNGNRRDDQHSASSEE
jgi:transcriptional regulator with XRE-family HTH domain